MKRHFLNPRRTSTATGLLRGIAVVVTVVAACTSAAETRCPGFLPAYYAPALNIGGKPLGLIRQGETNGLTQCLYVTEDQSMVLSVESIACDQPRGSAILNNIVGHINQTITSNGGSFVEITATEMLSEVMLTNASQTVFACLLPNSVQIWTFSGPPTNRAPLAVELKAIRSSVNRQRYEEALQAGNVSMGQWQRSIHDFAKELLASGRKADALRVLKHLLATAPFNYDAHLEYMETDPDPAAANGSANAVLKNAEAIDQISKAAAFLGAESRAIERATPLASNETGLQLILIPLTPCNPWLLDEAAQLYEQITNIPARIRRLNEVWSWDVPERVSRQRDIQGILIRLRKQNIDFTNWDRARYGEALRDAATPEDAVSRYWANDLIQKIDSEPGQYCVDRYVERLRSTLNNYRSRNNRTMYVAITEANIYSGDNNFVFSVASTDPESPASILSYYMMLGRTLREEFDSRRRLVERIAKELVPASLKQLGIPRSTDPTCPYSYSSGIARLDQKTLVLSEDVRRAIDNLRDPPTGATAR